MTVTVERMEKALRYLAETDIECANKKGVYEGLLDQRKTVIAIEFSFAKGGAELRKMHAYASDTYTDHMAKVNIALVEYESLRNKRRTEELVIDVWRSVNSSRNKGQIV